MPLTRRRLFAGLAAAAAAVAGLFGLRSASARLYDGPVSDHFDGTYFFDTHGVPPKRFTDLLRWSTAGGKAKWPAWAPSPYADKPPQRVDGAAWRICYVGHASLLLQTAGLNILFDPVWSERVSPFTFYGPKRVNDPGIGFDALPPIDVVLVSHGHYDHLDAATLSRLAARDNPRVVTPLGNDVIMKLHDPAIRAEGRDWGDRVALSPRIAVTLAPMRHWTARGLTDRNKALWAAFILETPAGRIYHVGDSGYGTGHHFRTARERHGPFRLAILPVGAYEPRWFMRDQHMDPEESLNAFADCAAELGLGHHYGTFQLTDEEVDAPERAFEIARGQAGIAADRFRLLKPGQVWEIPPT
jgi:L-ascorbate metabolism protein UlaG (beta-lactamase superfamily)